MFDEMKAPPFTSKTGATIHALYGFLGALSTWVHGALPAVNLASFTLYELDQDWRKGDWMDAEMCEWGLGFAIGCLILGGLKMIGIVP